MCNPNTALSKYCANASPSTIGVLYAMDTQNRQRQTFRGRYGTRHCTVLYTQGDTSTERSLLADTVALTRAMLTVPRGRSNPSEAAGAVNAPTTSQQRNPAALFLEPMSNPYPRVPLAVGSTTYRYYIVVLCAEDLSVVHLPSIPANTLDSILLYIPFHSAAGFQNVTNDVPTCGLSRRPL